jgi:hypothetical protein
MAFRIHPASSNIEGMNRRVMSQHSQNSGEAKIIGVTNDPVLRPIGALMAVVGAIWSLFWGMAVDAGTYHEPLAAVALVALGVVLYTVGKPSEQI